MTYKGFSLFRSEIPWELAVDAQKVRILDKVAAKQSWDDILTTCSINSYSSWIAGLLDSDSNPHQSYF